MRIPVSKFLAGLRAAAIIAAGSVFAALPLGIAKKAGSFGGFLLFVIWRKRRRIAISNVSAAMQRGAVPKNCDNCGAMGPVRIARESFMNLGASFAELIKIYFGTGGGILGRIEVRGRENFEKAHEGNRGIIFITAHMGNWELLAIKGALAFGGMGVVARPLGNPYLNVMMERARSKFGNKVIYKEGALKKMLRTLNAGGGVGVLMDQAVIKEEGYLVDFLGRPAWTTRMPVVMAKKTGAALVPAFIKRTAGGHELVVLPEIDCSGDEHDVLLRLNAAIGEQIKSSPSEWLWMHRRWKRTQTSQI
ncbi:MAG: lysophospholipid acyltransferase family protein [Nitrospiraceae bacterium]|nr:lysophospholipid acyltransferase family protein [Nitrospiraceae bacterium]